MKTSPLRLKSAAAAEDRARSVRSFAAAAALYAPLLIKHPDKYFRFFLQKTASS